jgi:hypothetical protein
MVNELWLCHQAAISSDSEEMLVAIGCIISSAKVPPDQPPPPLPPLTLSLTPVQFVCKKSKAVHVCPVESKGQTMLSLGEILKDISKVKLRPVERSPCGNTVRRTRTPISPSNILAAVLRKRCAAVQSLTPKPDYHDPINNSCKSQTSLTWT